MKKLLIVFAILFIAASMVAPPGSKEVLKKMHDLYAGKWYKTFREFCQIEVVNT